MPSENPKLTIRATHPQIESIRSSAKQQGMTVNAYVLSRVLPVVEKKPETCRHGLSKCRVCG